MSKLQTFITQEQLQKDLAFSELNLSDAFTRHAALYAHYATLSHKAEYQSDRRETAVKIAYATLAKKYRDDVVAAGEKRPTKDEIDNAVQLMPEYIAVVKVAHEAKFIAGLVKEAARAFMQRRDMLVQMGAASREEMKGELRMRELGATEDARKSSADRAIAIVGGRSVGSVA